jgi:hypothetical protein
MERRAVALPALIVLLAAAGSSARPSRAGLHVGRWTKPPERCPSSMVTDGPLLGNGDAGAALGGFRMSADGRQLQQSYYVGKMDFWTQQNGAGGENMYFSHVAPGHVSLKFGAPPPPPPQPPPPPPPPKALVGLCELAQHIPCEPTCEQKPGGCAVSCGVMGSWPLPTGPNLVVDVAKICDAEPSCVAFGLYSKFYELYNKSSSALNPVANKQWTLFYKNASCTLPGAKPAGSALPPPPTPQPLPPDVFSATQELLQARVNASMGSSKGAECGTVRSTAVMAPEHNVLLARISTTKDCAVELSLSSPNMYGLPITVGSSNDALTMARQNNKWQHNDATLTECAPLVVNAAALRDFVLPSGAASSSSFGSLVNGSSKDSCEPAYYLLISKYRSHQQVVALAGFHELICWCSCACI